MEDGRRVGRRRVSVLFIQSCGGRYMWAKNKISSEFEYLVNMKVSENGGVGQGWREGEPQLALTLLMSPRKLT